MFYFYLFYFLICQMKPHFQVPTFDLFSERYNFVPLFISNTADFPSHCFFLAVLLSP
uniref:Uncharacterized protein n=1 Tax=Anguilla anguilla TaxID=7936 RepID=A0A0E9S1G5_ANGAN